MKQPILETERLLIRGIELIDSSGLYQLDSNPAVQRYLGQQPISTEEEAVMRIELIMQQYEDFGIGRWAVVEKASNKFIGWTGFKRITTTVNRHSHFLDIGYRFVEDAWGKGFATEAGKACMDYAKLHLEHEKIYAISDIENLGSKNVLEKLGFKAVSIFTYEGLPHFWYE